MANLDEIIQILSDHTIEIVDENGTTNEVIDWTDYRSVADKILALGKPEPLAKNKQGENNCILEGCDETRQADSDICTKHLEERGNAIM